MEMEQIVAAVQNGDKTKYRYIIEHYEQKVFATTVRIVRDVSTAEDLVQEIFIKAYHNLAKYEPTGSFNAWLYRLAMHHCLDYVKKKRPVISDDELQIADDTYPENVVLLREKESQLEALLNELEQKDKAVLLLRYVNELRYDEIAEALKIPHNEVRNRLHRAKKKLRQVGTAKGGYFREMR